MDNNAQNLTNAQNQPQPLAGPAPRPPIPGPAQMGAVPRPLTPPTPISAMPNLGGPRPAVGPAPVAPGAMGPTPANFGAAAPGAINAPRIAPAPGAVPGGPNAPAAPGAPTANPAGAPAAKKGLPKKTQYIIIGCVAAVLIIGCIIAAIVIMTQNNKPAANTPTPPPVAVEEGKTPIEDLDKDAMLAAFDEMYSENYAVPEGFLTDEVAEYSYGNLFYLTDSYSDAKELEYRTYFDDKYTPVITTDSKNRYSLIAAEDKNGEIDKSQGVFVSFDSTYIDYTPGDSTSSNHNIPGLTVVNTDDDDILSATLPILNMSYIDLPATGVYDFKYEPHNNDATLDIYLLRVMPNQAAFGPTVGDSTAPGMPSDSSSSSLDPTSTSSSSSTGRNTTNASDAEEEADATDATDEESEDAEEEAPYLIAAIHIQTIVDFKTGEVRWKDYDGEIQEVVKSFGITQQEYADLQAKMEAATGAAQ